MIGGYLTQTAIYKEVTARDESNEPTAYTETTIKVRQTTGTKVVITPEGTELKINGTILCNQQLQRDSLLKLWDQDWRIMDCSPAVDLAGKIPFWEVIF